jgi:hypothetical protein
MPSAAFERAIPAIERPQVYTLDRTATGIDECNRLLLLARRVLTADVP